METVVGPDIWRGRNVLVTGATGLAGGAVVTALLERGARVAILAHHDLPAAWEGRVEARPGDLRDMASLERAVAGQEIVFHLGAQAIASEGVRSPALTFDTNIRGTWQLLEACRNATGLAAIVVASSDKAYGPSSILPYTEEHPLAARTPYEASKACADMLAQTYHTTYGLPTAVTRCGNMFGPGDQNFSRIVPATIRAVLRDERPVIRSDGLTVRDYLYVVDGAEAYLLVAERLLRDPAGVVGEAFNFSLEQPLTVLEVVATVLRLMGSTLTPEVLGAPTHDIPRQYLSAVKARDRLGWQPRIGFEAGLLETIDWYRAALAVG
ncbi:MAG TPA: NAD-dependent epimerase/dehydratase family protein [Acidimicrobiales bacterium]|nr:NAD-dependent epimerase/dehydratase family protein [Acidimicrobiales bacterium]